MWQRTHSSRTDAELARQHAELPLEPESIYDRLMRTRGVAMKATARTRTQQQQQSDDSQRRRLESGTSAQRIPEARLRQIEQEVDSNEKLRETSEKLTAARVQEHQQHQTRNREVLAGSTLYTDLENLPLQDFVATYGVQGDRQITKTVSRRAALAKEYSYLRDTAEDCATTCLPVLRLLIRTLILIL
eukprot:CAMPEP_0118955776 /NCGR_PEP_ID=MMETSP1169-20130426/60486_1 /TAXON_ID=36882 /ORGANISM="Pyramimonas obovata, Strain CCMP722" /LENGTH=187 /DNA_ID=CAMNT_0006903679 /DNA_START=161 /DNA_END=721 /DNA_ORIENTATION=+